jgi:hypothetical protein
MLTSAGTRLCTRKQPRSWLRRTPRPPAPSCPTTRSYRRRAKFGPKVRQVSLSGCLMRGGGSPDGAVRPQAGPRAHDQGAGHSREDAGPRQPAHVPDAMQHGTAALVRGPTRGRLPHARGGHAVRGEAARPQEPCRGEPVGDRRGLCGTAGALVLAAPSAGGADCATAQRRRC